MAYIVRNRLPCFQRLPNNSPPGRNRIRGRVRRGPTAPHPIPSLREEGDVKKLTHRLKSGRVTAFLRGYARQRLLETTSRRYLISICNRDMLLAHTSQDVSWENAWISKNRP